MNDSAHILTSAIRDPLRTASEIGGDIGKLVHAAAIDPALLDRDDGTLPLHRFVALNQIAASDLSAPHFGRLAARRFDLASIGPAGRAALAAPSLGAGLRLIERSFLAVQSDSELCLDTEGGVATLSYRILDPEIWPRDQDAELTIGVFAALVASVAGPGWRPLSLGFEHPSRGADRAAGGDTRCPVLYGAATNTLCFDAALLDRRPPGYDPGVFGGLATRLKDRVARIERETRVSTRVRRLILRHLGSPAADQTRIAASMGMSRRSLRRHLAEEDTSFSALLGECRDELARKLLRGSTLTTAEIADRLGYSEPSAFERGFRRRNGVTPARYRRAPA